MLSIFIVHFQPIEKYPPVINLLRYLSEHKDINTNIHVISTAEEGKRQIQIAGVIIQRCVSWKKDMSRKGRLQLYIRFNLWSFRELCKKRPEKLMYFETLSAGAPVLYKKWINRKTELYIHYHEYTSPQEYQTGMLLERVLHKMELNMYKHAQWVSHTNSDRMQLFLKDIPGELRLRTHILPNYPPRAWKTGVGKNKSKSTGRIGFVYVGALGLKTMYIQQFSNFIKNNAHLCYWHIYSDNYGPEVLEHFTMLAASNIDFKGAIEYDNLPAALDNYEIGVILYNGHIPNYVYNAPNKLFEYLACGLNVWFPEVMKGCHAYVTMNTTPEVRAIDFTHLDVSLLEDFRNRKKYEWSDPGFYCETSLPELTKQLLSYAG